GHKHLLGSNVDWGQGLLSLNRFLNKTGRGKSVAVFSLVTYSPSLLDRGPGGGAGGRVERYTTLSAHPKSVPSVDILAVSVNNVYGHRISNEWRARCLLSDTELSDLSLTAVVAHVYHVYLPTTR